MPITRARLAWSPGASTCRDGWAVVNPLTSPSSHPVRSNCQSKCMNRLAIGGSRSTPSTESSAELAIAMIRTVPFNGMSPTHRSCTTRSIAFMVERMVRNSSKITSALLAALALTAHAGGA